MTALEVRQALLNKFSDSREYAIAEEVGLTTGGGCRRLDMIVMDCYFGRNFRIDGFEIKVSTSDLRRELEVPEKHVAFFDVIDYYTLACPAGVVEPLIDIIPKNWGILIINDNLTTRYRRKPLALRDEKSRTVPRGFFASVTRAIQGRQPAAEELKAEYDRGFREGKERGNEIKTYMERKVRDGAKKIEEYEKLESRFRVYGEDLDEILEDFERFRKIDPDWIKNGIESAIKYLNRLKGYLEGKEW